MRTRFLLTTIAWDLASLGAAIVLASLIRYQTPMPWVAEDLGPVLASLALGMLVGSYLGVRTFADGVPRPSYGRALWIALATLGLTALFIVIGRPFYSRAFLGLTIGIWLVLALGHRAVHRRRPWSETMVLVTGEKELADDLLGSPHARILDIVDPASDGSRGPLPEGTTLVVDFRSVLSEEMARFVSSTNLAGYEMRGLTGVYEEHTGRLPIVHLHEGWELTVPVEARGVYEDVKRVVDVVLVALAAPFALLLGLAIAAAIRLDSGGPAIFAQPRVGRSGETFTIYKFRTMHDEDGVPFTVRRDARLTRVGRFLRKFRADELPQLWNVLRGDLSLVGPRPEWKVLADDYARSVPFYTHRQLVRPGITGWAQVNFGYADSEADVVERLSYDLYYVKHMSLWLDFQVLGRSFWTVLSGFGGQ